MAGEYRDKGYLWDEAIPTAFEEVGVTLPDLTTEQWNTIAQYLDEHVDAARDFMPPVPTAEDIFEMNERPRREADAQHIASLEATVKAYNDDILRVKGGRYTTIQDGRVVIHD